jgi:UDP-glucose 4-epimerase
MKVFVTGGAGFIGSHLSLKLLQQGYEVTVFDNLLLGRREFLKPCEALKGFRFVQGDLLDMEATQKAMAGHDFVYHLAANSDISQGAEKSDVDLKLGTIATYNVLECMRRLKIQQIVFSSTSAIYGEAEVKPTPEDYGPLIPISFYGASKLAAEALCTAFAHNCGMKLWIFRFANIVGSHSTHGVIRDFVFKLKKTPQELQVLGNGSQKKSYLHVSDCVDGLMFGPQNLPGPVHILNLASEGVTQVKFIAEQVVAQMGSRAQIRYGESDRGWVGDVPFTWLDDSKIKSLGWKAQLNSDEAVRKAVAEIVAELT